MSFFSIRRLLAVAALLAIALAIPFAGQAADRLGRYLPELTVGDPALRDTALAALGELDVKGRAPTTGYDRDEFGPAWADTDHNGCDTRNDVLRRDLTEVLLDPTTHGCLVLAGTLDDPYTGTTIDFERGRETSDDVQIDHVVPLSDAWQKGAQQWSDEVRKEFANDPLNLLAVDGPTNGSKGDGDAATWLPSNTDYRCPYAARIIAVKVEYRLWVTSAEHDALADILDGCPEEKLPEAEPFEIGPDPDATTTVAGAVDPRFSSCRTVREAGLGPYVRGEDAEYEWYSDGDGDGVVCE